MSFPSKSCTPGRGGYSKRGRLQNLGITRGACLHGAKATVQESGDTALCTGQRAAQPECELFWLGCCCSVPDAEKCWARHVGLGPLVHVHG